MITISVAAGVVGTEAKAVVYTAGSLTDSNGVFLANQTVLAGAVNDNASPVILTTSPADLAAGVATSQCGGNL